MIRKKNFFGDDALASDDRGMGFRTRHLSPSAYSPLKVDIESRQEGRRKQNRLTCHCFK
jgi:hypothetical protein